MSIHDDLTIKSTFRLRNNVEIPVLGCAHLNSLSILGTYQIKGEAAYHAVKAALEAGYRHIDTASVYCNEEFVGKAIKESGIPRSEIFLTTKLSPKDQGYACNEWVTSIELSYEAALEAFEASLTRLGVEFVDLYLIHWPAITGIPKERPENVIKRRESWRALEEIYRLGKARAIGVSNYTVSQLKDLNRHASTLPHVNQVEFHPRLSQEELHSYCKSKGIFIEAYSSLGQAKLLYDDSVKHVRHATFRIHVRSHTFLESCKIAKEVGKPVPLILLRWGLQKGTVILPKSDKPERIVTNTHVFGWSLSSEIMHRLDGLNKGQHFCWDPTDIPARLEGGEAEEEEGSDDDDS